MMISKLAPLKLNRSGGLTFIGGKFSHERELVWSSEKTLAKGVYIVFIEIDWAKSTPVSEYVVSTYSEFETSIEDVTSDYAKDEVLQQMLMA